MTTNHKTDRELLLALMLSIILIACNGCETYQKIPLAPDNLNYTHYFNDDGSPGQDAIGFSWNLGRKSPYNINSLK